MKWWSEEQRVPPISAEAEGSTPDEKKEPVDEQLQYKCEAIMWLPCLCFLVFLKIRLIFNV